MKLNGPTGAGRTPEQLAAKNLAATLSRQGEAVVTNAWSSATSPHGWTIGGEPAAAALDVVPIGADGKPWTKDDRWDDLVRLVAALGPNHGLMHFHAPGEGRLG